MDDELTALKHDIERAQEIASELATENERLRALLRELLLYTTVVPAEVREAVEAALAGGEAST